ILSKRLFEEGQVVKVGEVIATITPIGQNATTVAPTQPPTPAVTAQPVTEVKQSQTVTASANGIVNSEVKRISDSGRFYSPLVRTIAKEEGVSMAELEAISGSGSNNRVTKQDLLNYISTRKGGTTIETAQKPQPAAGSSSTSSSPANVTSVSGNVEIIEMDRMRKLIADHMVMSKHTSPHVTSFVEADVTNMVKWREKIKSGFEKKEGEKITFTPIFIEAVCRAIRDFPLINVSVDGNRIIIKKSINIGMATALPSGNLIVPVIKSADQLNLFGLTKAVNDLANRARQNKL
ncbi:MAG: 2-oxo acid dehydrogenase subunit E2, partial [Bacteroidota bacterium]